MTVTTPFLRACLAAALLATLSSTARSADAPKRYPVPVECMHAEQGHCFIASMDFGEEGDKYSGNKSMLMLFEDGKRLGAARSAHAEIRKQGQGRFSHWTRAGLYFSASDNSDPRSNGRKYEVASPNPRSPRTGPTAGT